ncbi:hypothetical protein A1QO_02840 [Vibrio genomosp. F10 str. ZF-129]|uniref:Transglycosylase SLT domain-containing protein n=1 Tax=Vibrio genomosp. F10 str. ZF-129 TaxID=1187848 RepID=A0A1E5BKD0_9VIBR|nr:hypothetical protein [Vibrio genomosp. F10]OEE38333.1 hypothetical protein A1QO_02840 [Vibrio genomosp. F10 str. ZF-129]
MDINRRRTIQSLFAGGALVLCPPALSGTSKVRKGKKIESAYIHAARKHSVPADVLFTIAHVESNDPSIKMPCPFAMNFNGRPYYFQSQEKLLTAARYLLEHGHKNFDIGPVQVNWYWHNGSFKSIEEASDPYISLDVGTAYLRTKFNSEGNWVNAAGKYHAPNNPVNAAKYEKKFVRMYKDLGYA